MFYLKLAINNFKKSLDNFSPFLLATTIMFMMTFIISNIVFSSGLSKLAGAQYAQFMMSAGLIIVILFSLILVSYSYRFLLKQRTREFGLYNILGLNKWQISTISLWELGIAFLITVITGTIIGIVLSQFLFLSFVKIIGGTYFNLGVSLLAVIVSVVTFLVIFCLLIAFAIVTIRRHTAISLLKENSRSEREPRGRVITSLISVILLGTAYYMAVTIGNPLMALMSFFIAALLVIIGTYLLYMGLTIFVLKRQKANQHYYYQPNHFITTSSMLYRMKTNAVGLANITVLVTMAFVTIATSVALYVGVQDLVKELYPKNAEMHTYSESIDRNRDNLNTFMQKNNIDRKKGVEYTSFTTQNEFKPNQDEHIKVTAKTSASNINNASLEFVTRDDMINLGNDIPELKSDQVLLYTLHGNNAIKTIDWYSESLSVIKTSGKLNNFPTSYAATDSFIIVVKDDQQLIKLNQKYNSENAKKSAAESTQLTTSLFSTNVYLNLSRAKQVALKAKETETVFVSSKTETKEMMDGFTGGFLFIGFILGITFILGAALIIYYKQISEGAEDKRSYRILQEIGLTKDEVKKAINSQVLIVFFMPIVVSIIHFSFAFVMIKKLIRLFGVSNSQIIFIVSFFTITLITMIYFLIYRKTSKIYYRIVER